MTKYRKCLMPIAFACLSLAAARAQDEKVLFANEAPEKVRVYISKETGMVTTQFTKVKFHDMRLFNPDRRLIAKETIITEYGDGSEGETGKAKIEFYQATGDPNSSEFTLPKTPTQTINIPDIMQVEFQSDHWSATTFGCCDAEPYTRLYAYGADSPFLRFNSGYSMVEVPNAQLNRYVGIVVRAQVPNDSAVAAIFGSNTKAVAAVTYAAPGKQLQKLLLQPKDGVKEEDIPYHTMGIKLLSDSPRDVPGYQEDKTDPEVLTMWSIDVHPEKRDELKAVSGLTIQAEFAANDGTTDTVTIKVDDDKFGTPTVKSKTLEAVPPKAKE